MVEPSIIVSFVGLIGTLTVGYWAYRGNKKTEHKVDAVPQTLVQEFARLNPGVDTVEKVIELLYTEIERLKRANDEKDVRIDQLVKDKADLLNEISSLKRKLGSLEQRVLKSINDDKS